ncbi:MAG: hypothetical protein AAF959_10550 [Cyanobacteria bacterium P01_D01_bin.56]
MFNRINLQRLSKQQSHQTRGTRTVDGVLALLEPNVARELSTQQWQEVRRIVQVAVGRPAPKIVDLNFTVDLLISRFYFRLLVGEDTRHENRKQSSGSRFGNLVAAISLIIALNVLVSISAIVVGYLIKSAIGIDLMPGHWRDWVMNRI